MATLTPVNTLMRDLAHGVHDFETDSLVLALTTDANAPAATDATLSDITQIAYTNLSARAITVSSSAVATTNDYALALSDLTLTASGGAVATFRHGVIYNDTAAGDELVGFFDFGADVTLADGESRTIQFSDDNALELTV